MPFRSLPCHLLPIRPNLCCHPVHTRIKPRAPLLLSVFLDSKLEDKRFCTEWQQAVLEFNLLLSSSCTQLCLVGVFPKHIFELSPPTFLKMYCLPTCSASVPADIQATHHINLYYTHSLCMYDPLTGLSFRTTTFPTGCHCVR